MVIFVHATVYHLIIAKYVFPQRLQIIHVFIKKTRSVAANLRSRIQYSTEQLFMNSCKQVTEFLTS